jgi:hypothetical protein
MIKEMWLAVRAVVALLKEDKYYCCLVRYHGNLHPNPNINITSRDCCRAEENMCTVAAWTSNLHGVRPAMAGGAVKSDVAALFIDLAYYRVVFERRAPKLRAVSRVKAQG